MTDGNPPRFGAANMSLTPQQSFFGISGASARSKGQARRRNQPTASDGDRKAQRNLARRERARCKKAQRTDRKPLSSAQSLPLANQSQYPTMTVFSALPNHTNLQNLSHSGRATTAQSKMRYERGVFKGHIQKVEDVSVLLARDMVELEIAAQEQDLDAAGILVEVAREQHPVSPAAGKENTLIRTRGVSGADANVEHSRKCPIITCPYHVDIGPWSKTEKDKHIMTHFERYIEFVIDNCHYSLPWPNFVEAPDEYFDKIENLKYSIRNYPEWASHDSGWLTCWICSCAFDLSGYVEHLDSCIVWAVQVQASVTAQACPVPLCDHQPIKEPSRFHMDTQLIKPYWPSLGCGRCYTDQCQCPAMQMTTGRSAVKKS